MAGEWLNQFEMRNCGREVKKWGERKRTKRCT